MIRQVFDERVATFARVKLIAKAGGRINTASAHAEFEAFQKGRGGRSMAFDKFAEQLALLAAAGEGGVDCDAVTGLAWAENKASLFVDDVCREAAE